jgi:hypothetical protein
MALVFKSFMVSGICEICSSGWILRDMLVPIFYVGLRTNMLIDVEDTDLNTVLNACFVANVALTLLALVPWRVLGAPRLCRLFRWVSIPVLILAFVYESYMPTGYNIRVDLLILLPLYFMALATSVVRWNLESRR